VVPGSSTSASSDEPPRTAVVLLAAGEGRRVGAGTNKVLLPLRGEPVFTWSLRASLATPRLTHLVLVIRPEDREEVDRGLALVGERHPGASVWLASGGVTRHDSEWRALQVLADAVDAGEVDVVVVHDTARPLAGPELFAEVSRVAARHGGALPVRPQRWLLPRSLDDGGQDESLVAVQTPQAFRARPLLAAYRAAARDGFTGTDTASCLERYTDVEIRGVESPATNLKITFAEDVRIAERLLSR
jgi:2-C-methyl-D-erythritol 4-phosphate cytidylyltransferase